MMKVLVLGRNKNRKDQCLSLSGKSTPVPSYPKHQTCNSKLNIGNKLTSWIDRDKSPEYVLFMLNRQTVRNVTIPLVPGEMKLTVVDTSTLQVARRGESGSILKFLDCADVVPQNREGGYGLVKDLKGLSGLSERYCSMFSE